MGIPDSLNFTLQDVVDEIAGYQAGLQDCFDDAIAAYFNEAYQGSKDRLSNFRGYGTNVEYVFDYDSSNEGFIDHSGTGWSTIRGATAGSNVTTDTSPFEIYVDDLGGGDYEIVRTFFTFDLSSIPVSATCIEAVLGFRVLTEYNTTYHTAALAALASYGPTIEVADYDAYTNATLVLDIYEAADSRIWESILYFTNQIRASGSAQKGLVSDKFGTDLQLAIINEYYDQQDFAPSTKSGIQLFKAGEVYTPPQLYVKFTTA